MKKLLCLLLAAAICVSLCGCGEISELLEEYVGKFTDSFGKEDSSREESVEEENPREELVEENPFQRPETEVETGVVQQTAPKCPYPYSQKLTVSASAGSSYATATLYEWENGDWQQTAVYNARVGKNGIGAAAEGSLRTPMGTHKLGIVLSANAVNTNMPTRTVSASTCVVDDKNSPYYNIIMEKSQVPNGTSSDPIGNGLTNGTTYATIYIEHNGSGLSSENVVPGKGSAIGLRGQYGSMGVTYGDVDISYSDMVDLLSRLDADKEPVIEIVLE